MKNNTPPAAFSLTTYYFEKVIMDLSHAPNKDLSISFEPKGHFDADHAIYNLFFSVKISCNGVEEPFIEVGCKGVYTFQNVANKESIPDYFYNNSIAILFPYVRAYVSMITTQANIPGIILPTLNLSSLGSGLKKRTE